jgi:hypothetical protein
MHAGVKLSTDPAHLAAVEQERYPLAVIPKDTTPAQELLYRVRYTAAEVDALDAMIGQLRAEELTWGTVTEEVIHREGQPAGTRWTSGARLNELIILREHREKMLLSACDIAIRAGLEARMIELHREQGAALARMLMATLTEDFGVRPDDPRIAAVLPVRLRQLDAAWLP